MTSSLRVSLASLTVVIGTVVHNNRSAKNAVGTNQLHPGILLGSLSNTVRVGGDVSQVSNVSLVVLGSTVLVAKWVEMRASRSTTVGVVTKSVDVETSQGIWIVTSDLPGDGGWVRLGSLLELNDSGNGLVSSYDGNY